MLVDCWKRALERGQAPQATLGGWHRMVQPTGSVQYVNPGLYNTCITEQQYNDMVAATAPAQSTQQQVTFGELCSRLYSMHKASVKMVEMPVTLAALYLINGGETTHHSHQFVPYATYPIIAEAFGESFKSTAVHNSATGVYHEMCPVVYDYGHRRGLRGLNCYEFMATYHKVRGCIEPNSGASTRQAKVRFTDAHPQADTHYLQKNRHEKVPLPLGSRVPNMSVMKGDNDSAKQTYYKYALAFYKPWGGGWGRSLAREFERLMLKKRAELKLLRGRARQAWLAQNGAYVGASVGFNQVCDAHGPREGSGNGHLRKGWRRKRGPGRDAAEKSLRALLRNTTAAQQLLYETMSNGQAQQLLAQGQNYHDQVHLASRMRASRNAVLNPFNAQGEVAGYTEDSGDEDPAAFDEAGPLPTAVKARGPNRDTRLLLTHCAAAIQTATPADIVRACAAVQSTSTKPEEPATTMHHAPLFTGPHAAFVMWVVEATATATDNPAHPATAKPVAVRACIANHGLDQHQGAVFAKVAMTLLLYHLDQSSSTAAARTLLQNELQHHQLLMTVLGQGGTGKSKIITAILAFAADMGLRNSVEVVAFAGSAAINVHGKTMHSVAHCAKKMPALTKMAQMEPLARVKLYIIDEISMVSSHLFGVFERNVRILSRANGQKPFAGASVVCFGDFDQLPPTPKSCSLYAKPSGSDSSFARKGRELWRSFNAAAFLTKNYRSQADEGYAAFLLRVRNRCCTPADIKQLNSRVVGRTCKPPLGAPVVYGINEDVNAAAHEVASAHGAATGGVLYRARAELFTADNAAVANREPGYCVGREQSGQKAHLPLTELIFYIGAPVTLPAFGNQHNDHGVASGSRGHIVGTCPPLHTLPTVAATIAGRSVHTLCKLPDHLLVHVPGCTLKHQNLPIGVVAVPPTTKKILTHSHLRPVTVRQFKVRPSHSITGHKMQGLQADAIVIGKFPGRRDWNNWAYTMLSRAKTWSGLFLLRPVRKASTLYSDPDPDLDADMRRLRRLASKTSIA